VCVVALVVFFFSSRRRHTRFSRDWSSDVCSSDLLPHSDRPRPVYCNVLGDYAPLQQSPWTSVCISLALELSTWYQVHTRLRGPSPGARSRTPTYGFGDRRASVTPHPSSGPSPTLPCRSPLQLIYQDLRDQSNRFSWVSRGLFGPCLAVLLC